MWLALLESLQLPDGLGHTILQYQIGHHLPDRRPMLEPMPGPASEQPHILVRRMSVHNEVTVGRLLVLADASLNQRRIAQCRESEADIFANVLKRFGTDHPLSVTWIEFRPPRIVGNLEPAAVAAGDAIPESSVMIGPHRHVRITKSRIARKSPEEKHILLGSLDQLANCPWEQLPQPRTAGKHKPFSSKL